MTTTQAAQLPDSNLIAEVVQLVLNPNVKHILQAFSDLNAKHAQNLIQIAKNINHRNSNSNAITKTNSNRLNLFNTYSNNNSVGYFEEDNSNSNSNSNQLINKTGSNVQTPTPLPLIGYETKREMKEEQENNNMNMPAKEEDDEEEEEVLERVTIAMNAVHREEYIDVSLELPDAKRYRIPTAYFNNENTKKTQEQPLPQQLQKYHRVLCKDVSDFFQSHFLSSASSEMQRILFWSDIYYQLVADKHAKQLMDTLLSFPATMTTTADSEALVKKRSQSEKKEQYNHDNDHHNDHNNDHNSSGAQAQAYSALDLINDFNLVIEEYERQRNNNQFLRYCKCQYSLEKCPAMNDSKVNQNENQNQKLNVLTTAEQKEEELQTKVEQSQESLHLLNQIHMKFFHTNTSIYRERDKLRRDRFITTAHADHDEDTKTQSTAAAKAVTNASAKVNENISRTITELLGDDGHHHGHGHGHGNEEMHMHGGNIRMNANRFVSNAREMHEVDGMDTRHDRFVTKARDLNDNGNEETKEQTEVSTVDANGNTKKSNNAGGNEETKEDSAAAEVIPKSSACASMMDENLELYKNTKFGVLDFGDQFENWVIDRPLYGSIEEEVMNNSFSCISREFLDEIIDNSKALALCNKAQKYNLSWRDILCIKLYTDTSQLCNHFRRSYRTSSTEMEKFQLRSQFYHWARHMRFLFEYKSVPYSDALYHGLSAILTLNSLTPKYNGPVSTTSSFSVAQTFAGADGMVLLVKSGMLGEDMHEIPAIDVSWISRYSNECEVLVYDAVLPIRHNQIVDHSNIQKRTSYLEQILQGLNTSDSDNVSLKRLIKNWLPAIVQISNLFEKNVSEFNRYLSLFEVLFYERKLYNIAGQVFKHRMQNIYSMGFENEFEFLCGTIELQMKTNGKCCFQLSNCNKLLFKYQPSSFIIHSTTRKGSHFYFQSPPQIWPGLHSQSTSDGTSTEIRDSASLMNWKQVEKFILQQAIMGNDEVHIYYKISIIFEDDRTDSKYGVDCNKVLVLSVGAQTLLAFPCFQRIRKLVLSNMDILVQKRDNSKIYQLLRKENLAAAFDWEQMFDKDDELLIDKKVHSLFEILVVWYGMYDLAAKLMQNKKMKKVNQRRIDEIFGAIKLKLDGVQLCCTRLPIKNARKETLYVWISIPGQMRKKKRFRWKAIPHSNPGWQSMNWKGRVVHENIGLGFEDHIDWEKIKQYRMKRMAFTADAQKAAPKHLCVYYKYSCTFSGFETDTELYSSVFAEEISTHLNWVVPANTVVDISHICAKYQSSHIILDNLILNQNSKIVGRALISPLNNGYGHVFDVECWNKFEMERNSTIDLSECGVSGMVLSWLNDVQCATEDAAMVTHERRLEAFHPMVRPDLYHEVGMNMKTKNELLVNTYIGRDSTDLGRFIPKKTFLHRRDTDNDHGLLHYIGCRFGTQPIFTPDFQVTNNSGHTLVSVRANRFVLSSELTSMPSVTDYTNLIPINFLLNQNNHKECVRFIANIEEDAYSQYVRFEFGGFRMRVREYRIFGDLNRVKWALLMYPDINIEHNEATATLRYPASDRERYDEPELATHVFAMADHGGFSEANHSYVNSIVMVFNTHRTIGSDMRNVEFFGDLIWDTFENYANLVDSASAGGGAVENRNSSESNTFGWMSMNGGGCIKLKANEITLHSKAKLFADGQHAMQRSGAGGGEGGSIIMDCNALSVPKKSLIRMSAIGGDTDDGQVTKSHLELLASNFSQWQCQRCTFINEYSHSECQVCTTPKIESQMLNKQPSIHPNTAEEELLSGTTMDEDGNVVENTKRHNGNIVIYANNIIVTEEEIDMDEIRRLHIEEQQQMELDAAAIAAEPSEFMQQFSSNAEKRDKIMEQQMLLEQTNALSFKEQNAQKYSWDTTQIACKLCAVPTAVDADYFAKCSRQLLVCLPKHSMVLNQSLPDFFKNIPLFIEHSNSDHIKLSRGCRFISVQNASDIGAVWMREQSENLFMDPNQITDVHSCFDEFTLCYYMRFARKDMSVMTQFALKEHFFICMFIEQLEFNRVEPMPIPVPNENSSDNVLNNNNNNNNNGNEEQRNIEMNVDDNSSGKLLNNVSNVEAQTGAGERFIAYDPELQKTPKSKLQINEETIFNGEEKENNSETNVLTKSEPKILLSKSLSSTMSETVAAVIEKVAPENNDDNSNNSNSNNNSNVDGNDANEDTDDSGNNTNQTQTKQKSSDGGSGNISDGIGKQKSKSNLKTEQEPENTTEIVLDGSSNHKHNDESAADKGNEKTFGKQVTFADAYTEPKPLTEYEVVHILCHPAPIFL